MKLKTFLATIVVASGSAGLATAATATFDLRQGPVASTNSAYSADISGIDLSVRGAEYRGKKVRSGRSPVVSRNGASGLGLMSKGRDNYRIDGSGRKEMAVLDFGQEVKLTSITFGSVGKGKAKFDLFVFNDGAWTRVAGKLNKRGRGDTQVFEFDQAYEGGIFGVGAKGKRTAFTIDAVTAEFDRVEVETPGNNDLPAVPLPAGGLLLMTGIAGIGVMRRKKRS